MFPTDLGSIIQRLDHIDPLSYAHTRNYLDGDVTKLSPYISRGVLSTRWIADSLIRRGFEAKNIIPFLQELAWRDYFQLVWKNVGSGINVDLRNSQLLVENEGIPISIVNGSTGILTIDKAINDFYQTGYMHNHARMYIAALACNFGRSHWKNPANWMYYHLLDGDWASNACSWQWVAGAFSSKKYIVNQENINKYSKLIQTGTFLDCSYEDLLGLDVPEVLKETERFSLKTNLPKYSEIRIDPSKPVYLYNYYNIDPSWHQNDEGDRILLLEPSHFDSFPVSDKSVQFLLDLANNIKEIQVFVGEFDQLSQFVTPSNIYFKEHPTAMHYIGNCENREWMFPEIQGYFPSFFSYWKKCQKFLNQTDYFKTT